MTSFRVHLRGLPWQATEDDVKKFFEGCLISRTEDSIHFLYNKNGRSSGEAYVEFDTDEDYHKALQKDKQYIGNRYIEVSPYNDTASNTTRNNFESSFHNDNSNDGVFGGGGSDRGGSDENWSEPIVRLRGLPFSCTKDDVKYFFRGLQVAPDGITLASDFGGKRTGQAFVQFINMDNANRALEFHKKEIGHRYIEVFKSGLREAKNFIYGCLYDNYRSVMSTEQLNNTIDLLNQFSDQFANSIKNPSAFQNFQIPDFGDTFGGKRKEDDDYGGSSGKRARGMSGGGGGEDDDDSKFVSTTGYSIHMRGLPFDAKDEDVREFFKPYILAHVELGYNERSRFTGEADADFYSLEDAQAAVKYDRRHIGKRYIELFLVDTSGNKTASKPDAVLPSTSSAQPVQSNLQNYNSYYDAIKSLTQTTSTAPATGAAYDTYTQQAAAAAAYAYSTNMQNYQQYYTQSYQTAAANNPATGYNPYT